MDLKAFELLMRDLRLANECEAAAAMDVEDAKGNLEFYQRKLDAAQALLDERREACQEVADKMGEYITQETAAPLLLTSELEQGAND